MGSMPSYAPFGPTQVAAAVALRERLDTQPAAAKVKAQVMDDFGKALAAFPLRFRTWRRSLQHARRAEFLPSFTGTN
jgi:hypothetical protein